MSTTMVHFNISEFDFKGAGANFPPIKAEGKMSADFLQRIDRAREIAGVPFKITSGYRPKEYDWVLRPTWPHNVLSDHAAGCGADIAFANSNQLYHILRGLFGAGFTRIGVNFDNLHVHASTVDSSLPQYVFFKD